MGDGILVLGSKTPLLPLVISFSQAVLRWQAISDSSAYVSPLADRAWQGDRTDPCEDLHKVVYIYELYHNIYIYIYMYICLLSTIIILLLSNVESYSQSNHYFQWNVWNMQGGFRLWLMTSHDPCPHQERDVDGRGPRHREFEARNGYPTHTWDMTPYNVQHIIRLQMFV